MNLIFRVFVLVASSVLIGCEASNSSSQPPIDAKGLFWFGEASSDEDLPDHIDPKSVLCYGKGLKVGRCISDQLSKGKCLGLSKYNKKVIAVEVHCNVMSRDSVELPVMN
jgi:hypothetical protein